MLERPWSERIKQIDYCLSCVVTRKAPFSNLYIYPNCAVTAQNEPGLPSKPLFHSYSKKITHSFIVTCHLFTPHLNRSSLIRYFIHQIWHQMILGCFPKIKSSNEDLLTLKVLRKSKWYRPWRQFQKRSHRRALSNGMSVLVPGVAFLLETTLIPMWESSYISLLSVSSPYGHIWYLKTHFEQRKWSSWLKTLGHFLKFWGEITSCQMESRWAAGKTSLRLPDGRKY